MRREYRRRSALSIKAQEFRPRFHFLTRTKEFVPVREIVRKILKEKLEKGLKKKMKIMNEELKEEMKEKEKELVQLMTPLSVNAKVFVPANCLYRYF